MVLIGAGSTYTFLYPHLMVSFVDSTKEIRNALEISAMTSPPRQIRVNAAKTLRWNSHRKEKKKCD